VYHSLVYVGHLLDCEHHPLPSPFQRPLSASTVLHETAVLVPRLPLPSSATTIFVHKKILSANPYTMFNNVNVYGWFGVVVTALVISTKLSYIKPS